MTGEDLTCLGVVPVQADLALVATLGLAHVERNAHHYYPGLSYLPECERRPLWPPTATSTTSITAASPRGFPRAACRLRRSIAQASASLCCRTCRYGSRWNSGDSSRWGWWNNEFSTARQG